MRIIPGIFREASTGSLDLDFDQQQNVRLAILSVGGNASLTVKGASLTPGSATSRIQFEENSSGSLTNCSFDGGGQNSGSSNYRSGQVYIASDNVTLTGCSFANSEREGVYLRNAAPTIHDCDFSGSEVYAIFSSTSLAQPGLSITDCTFTDSFSSSGDSREAVYLNHHPDLVFTGNTWDDDSIALLGSSPWDSAIIHSNSGAGEAKFSGTFSNLTLPDANHPWYFSGTVSGSLDLDFDQQQNVRLAILSVGGNASLTVKGASLTPGSATSRIQFEENSSGSLTNCSFDGGGQNSGSSNYRSGQVYIASDNVTLTGCSFANSEREGVYLRNAAPTIHDCDFSGSEVYAIFSSTSVAQLGLSITDCTFTDSFSSSGDSREAVYLNHHPDLVFTGNTWDDDSIALLALHPGTRHHSFQLRSRRSSVQWNIFQPDPAGCKPPLGIFLEPFPVLSISILINNRTSASLFFRLVQCFAHRKRCFLHPK